MIRCLPVVRTLHTLPTLFFLLAVLIPLEAAGDTPLPPDTEYVQVVDGHLAVNGERQRYWAAIGQLYVRPNIKPSDTPAQAAAKVAQARRGTDVLIQRFKDLGFNGFRLWTGYHEPQHYTVGDGSRADSTDYFIKRASEEGFRIWFAGMNRQGEAVPEDADILPDAPDAEAWAEAVREMCRFKDGRLQRGWALNRNLTRVWDERIAALALQRMKTVATHYNRHTGLRWCDDPTMAVWELSNEEWWMRKMVAGRWQRLPAYFRNKLIARWNGFLHEKYGSDAALAAAWDGVLDGESLARQTVLLAPMAGQTDVSASINDANRHAVAAVQALEQAYSRDDFAEQRAADVLEFFMTIQLEHKQREAAAIKPLGKSTRLSPMIFDTGIGYEIQSQFLHQHADAVAHNAYVDGGGPPLEQLLARIADQPNEQQKLRVTQEAERRASNSDRWVNWLLKPPGISLGVPWLEHNRVAGKPFLCYETQIQQAAKYRADYPLRLAALASIQDWDWVCWHYFGDLKMLRRVGVEERPFDFRMDVTTGGHPQGYHFTYDEVQSAMMRAAGYMFRQQKYEPAPTPTTFIYGRDALYDGDSMDYGGSYGKTGLDMLQTTYQHGVRIQIDPTRSDNEVRGPVVSIDQRHTFNPYTPTGQITFDWKQGYLAMLGSQSVAWTGLMGRIGGSLELGQGVTLRDVSVHNPEGIYAPIDDEKYIAFALYSRDGKPLDRSQRIALSLVSTSFNTGFKPGGQGKRGVAGELPVLVARVAGTVEASFLDGMRYTFRDWHMQPIATGTVEGGTLAIPNDQPIFLIELER